MKIHGSRYEHEPIPGKKIAGMLLRVSFGVWNEGYADLQPWPEYGDQSLDEQIHGLQSACLSPLVKKCLLFAGHDAKARRANRNLLHGLDLPSTHALIDSSSSASDFRYWKIKMMPETDLSKIPAGVRLRLDFNGRLTYAEFLKWWKSLSSATQAIIDVIEDPYSTGEAHVDTRLYSDWIENSSWPGKVLKPSRDFSRQEYQRRRYKSVMFTHSLNHPLGQVAAIWEAARFYKKYPQLKQAGGFDRVRSSAFKPFNDIWKRQGPKLKPAPGLGFGFDSLLGDLRWERWL